MNKKALFIGLLVVAVAILGGLKLLSSQRGGIGGFRVDSQPPTSVFLNDKLIGKTPLEDKHPSGEYIVKLIPDDSSTSSSSWQGKITINPSVLTYINRQLGASELTSSGEILLLEKIAGSEAQVSVSSQPDAVTILLDGQEKGVAPATFSVAAGEHDVSVTSAGFASRTVRIQAINGYKVVVVFQLALSGGVTPPSPTTIASSSAVLEERTSAIPGPSIRIKDTPTGFLRVRKSASTSATEIGQVKPGQSYPFLEENDGWFKISYQEGKDGWISSKYAEKVQ